MPLSVPSPYNEYPKSTVATFRRFHELTNEWPWELVEYFEPHRWSKTLTQLFYQLIKNDLPRTSTTLNDLVNYLFDRSAEHPMQKYRCILSNKTIKQASDWLAGQRQGSFRFRAQRLARRGGALPSLTRSSLANRARISASRSLTPEAIQASDGSEAVPNEKASSSATGKNAPNKNAPMAKKRLMVHINLQHKPASESITVVGDEADQIATQGFASIGQPCSDIHTGLQTPVGDSGRAEESPFDGVSFRSLEEAQEAHDLYLKGQLTSAGIIIRRTKDEIESTRLRHREHVQQILNETAAKDQIEADVAEAQKKVRRKEAEYAVNVKALRQARLYAAENPDGNKAAASAAEKARIALQELDAGNLNINAEKKRLADKVAEIKMTEAQAAALSDVLIQLEEKKESQEKDERDISVLRRLVAMGPKLVDFIEELLGGRDIEEWSKEKLQEAKQSKI
ncbi:uncharacterized protein B0J16DRAFT_388166 [Fusarium flagelliforme]|uniref:Uncharacterized protein n=1 Tax=Fusarium flagelliforme TaxID=2675880 RepID=A0A395MLV1_9HYPO|nr:uncharacterized protein B0J16DRAFT_388166 [Fusarium flagelliforme]KAH7174349.1 hypothetical protein B0J16DRAFT_388166 [Fusarium flagelliforme]RFN48918.1 hypothetical protein FIE12Z_6847 [Fusarium flagelliforme]